MKKLRSRVNRLDASSQRKWWLFFPMLMLLWGLSAETQAQCTLVCNGPTPSGASNVGVDANCEVELFADMVLEGTGNCPGPKTLEVRTLAGNLIVLDSEPVLIPSAYLGQTLEVTVYDDQTGNNCTGYIMLEDNTDPVLANCDDLEVSCIEGFDPDDIGGATVTDNCDPNPSLNHTDQIDGPNCDPNDPYILVVTRTWTATDNNNNQSMCTQVISVLRESIEDVEVPSDAFLSCDAPDADPEITGYPTLLGFEIDGTNHCQITADYSDDTVFTCQPALHSYVINRTWLVTDNCPSTGVESLMQKIFVEDNTNPTVSCPTSLTFGTDGGTLCTGSFFFPSPTLTDNCSNAGDITYVVNFPPYGSFGPGEPAIGIPVGVYTVTYKATDECGNMGLCETTVNVIDDDVPTPVCDEFTVVTIPSNGVAIVPAINLDDGSYDNCSAIDFEASRDGGATYNSFLTFDCSDLGQSVDVILRVFEVANPASFNECDVVVNVQDQLPPVLDCPDDQTIDCQEFFEDLSVYGEPLVFENCSFTLTSDSTITLDNCGEGTIVRTWTAEDESGNTTSCTQTLTVENLTPFNGNTINFPPDYTVENTCLPAEEYDPEDLPPPFNEPDIPEEVCALAAVNYSDQLFYTSYPACYKIVRVWTVIDWCFYDPANPDNGGIWSETQVIKILDTQAPEVTFSPNDTTVAVGSNCLEGIVELDPVTADDCSPNIVISNNSIYADGGGADASGNYPLGEHEIVFTIQDGCGNTTRDTVVVTVEDQTPPSPVCLVGLSAELGNMNGVVMTTVPATYLLEDATDNCTDPSDIEVYIDLDDPTTPNIPTTTSLDFFCDDVGFVDVEIWVVDAEGNGDFCTTTVEIEDNMDLCPGMSNFAMIAGAMHDENGNEIDEIDVFLSGPMNAQTSGSPYEFTDLETGYDYSVAPEKDTDPGNGVTTYDMVLISRHILNVEPLDTPYKIIAADANRSGSISTVDLVAIQKIILNMEENFPGNTSWRFVDSAYDFPDPSDPFAEEFPEVVNINNLTQDELDADFVGVKVGDVNGSAVPNSNFINAGQRGFVDVLYLSTQDQMVEAGKVYDLVVSAANFNDIVGFQMTMEFDPTLMQPVDVESCDLPDLSTANFGFSHAEDGMITCSWNLWNGLTLPDGTCLFVLRMEALQSGYLGNALTVSSALTPAEAYWPDGSLLDIQLNSTPLSTTAAQEVGFELYQNRPNPFNGNSVIGFRLGEASEVSLKIFDLSGKLVHWTNGRYAQGYHEWKIQRADLPQAGMYYYQLETQTGTQTRKMILLD